MAYRNKTFVSFDGDNDMRYYRLMTAWKANDRFDFNFYDAHDLNTARDSSQEQTIKRRLRERLNNAKVVVSLIGDRTRFLFKFVRWELEQALQLGIPIVGVNLSGRRSQDVNLCPPVLRDELVIYVSFRPAIIQHALIDWPSHFDRLRREGESGPYYYTDDVYQQLGIEN